MNGILQLRALMGHLICKFYLVQSRDPCLNRMASVNECLQLLLFFQSLTEWLLPKESFCWLVFNGQCLLSKGIIIGLKV